MLLVRDLRFLVSVVVAGFTVLIVPLIGILVRQQCRRSAARKEEIKRLLVQASEDTARAELEDNHGYGYGRFSYPPGEPEPEPEPELEHEVKEETNVPIEAELHFTDVSSVQRRLRKECEVCSSSTAGRCAQCKRVYYCSGKCQIIHWRQGHKDECRPFGASDWNTDADDCPVPNPLIPPSSNGGGKRHPLKPVKKSTDDYSVSHSGILKSRDGNYVNETMYLEKQLRRNSKLVAHTNYELPGMTSIHKSDVNVSTMDVNNCKLSGRHQFVHEDPNEFGMNCSLSDRNKPASIEDSHILSSGDRGSTLKHTHVKPGPPREDNQCGSSSSSLSGSSVDECNESSFSEPSTSSSEFWEGMNNFPGTRGDIDDLDSRLSTSYHVSAENRFTCINAPISHVRKSNDVPPAKSGIKEPTDGLASSVLINKFVKKSERLSMREERSGNSNVIDVDSNGIAATVKSKQFVINEDAKANIPPDKSKCNTFTDPKSVQVKSLLSKASKLVRLNPLGVPSESVGRYSDKGLFQYQLFVKLYNWNKVELLPRGLINCGNSCYANAVLQCLVFTPPLTAYFLQGLHSNSCNKSDWCFTCELERLVLKAKDGHSLISPSRIISQIQHIGSHLGNGREEDAHEFLRYSIDAMQSICLKEAGVSASSSSEETTLIGVTFGGYLRSKIECMKCGGKSERHEKMMDLTVEIEGDIGTLEEALRHFTRTETLDGENKYQCDRCKSFEKARKKLRVVEAPNVLTIVLKRFQSGKFGKLNKTIKFPEILNMAPYMSGTSDKTPVYRLYGVVVHLDIMNAAVSGHYICYVKNSHNKWFKINDSTVKQVELERVLTKGAYMLLYARCLPRAPRVLRSTINERDSRIANESECKSRYPSRHPWDMSISNKRSSSGLEDNSYDNSSSSLFSEEGNSSYSTDSSTTRDSASTDYYDRIFGGAYWNSSDSETLSSTSSPSPMYLRRSSYVDYDHFASRFSDTSVPGIAADDEEDMCHGSSKHGRKLCCNNSSDSRKSRWANPFDSLKSSVTFRQSSRGRTD